MTQSKHEEERAALEYVESHLVIPQPIGRIRVRVLIEVPLSLAGYRHCLPTDNQSHEGDALVVNLWDENKEEELKFTLVDAEKLRSLGSRSAFRFDGASV